MKTRKLFIGITLLASLFMVSCNNTTKSEQNDSESENTEEVESEDEHTYEIEVEF